MTEAPDILLRVEDLQTHFISRDGANKSVAKSVDGVSFDVKRGETVAVVGESGSGKSVTSLSIMRLIAAPPGRIVGGRMLYRLRSGAEVDLAALPEAQMRAIRGREIAMIFQEPMTSLNPLYTVGDQIAEIVMLHEGKGRHDAMERAREMLDLVEIPAASSRLDDYPHQMSGGMRQRVMIALALACTPSLLIADEPTTALDVTIQAQILDLLRRLQGELGMGILFITHNLGVVAEIAHRVVVMYAGRVVEQADVEALFDAPRHPYTRGLMECVPRPGLVRPDGTRPPLPVIPGQVPSPYALPRGCAFQPRCGEAVAACETSVPELVDTGAGHRVRCVKWGAR